VGRPELRQDAEALLEKVIEGRAALLGLQATGWQGGNGMSCMSDMRSMVQFGLTMQRTAVVAGLRGLCIIAAVHR
jgi:hypothetical protein